MTYSKRIRMSVAIIFLALFAGCASVDVKRVRDSDYDTHGFRFYRPRPYIVVNKPFPVAGDDFFVSGQVDSSNRIVAIDVSQLPAPLRDYFRGHSEDGKAVQIPFSVIYDSPEMHSQQGLSASGHGNPTTNSAAPAPSTNPSGAPTGGGAAPPGSTSTTQPSSSQSASVSATQPTTQQAMLTTTSDPTVDPFEKLNDYVGIIYLPDFDQQYAISLSGGLGTASASLQMKNGWMTENAAWNVDNRQLGQFVFSNITNLINLATTVAEQAIAPGSAELSNLAAGATKNTQQGEQTPATVLLRIRYVLQASPGVYPLLKPGETACVDEITAAKHHVLLPLPPYTVVAYNCRTTVAVELVSISPQAAVGASAPVPAATQSFAGTTDNGKAVTKWLADNPVPGVVVDTNVPFGLTSDGTLIIPVKDIPVPDPTVALNAARASHPLPLLNGAAVKAITLKRTS